MSEDRKNKPKIDPTFARMMAMRGITKLKKRPETQAVKEPVKSESLDKTKNSKKVKK